MVCVDYVIGVFIAMPESCSRVEDVIETAIQWL
jgi:hypothetical protein